MEIWQVNQLSENLAMLEKFTDDHNRVLAQLKSEGTISEADINLIQAKEHKREKALVICSILGTKPNGYSKLIKALIDNDEVESAQLLIEIPAFKIGRIKIQFLGDSYEVKTYLSGTKIGSIQSWLMETLTVKEILEIHEHALNQEQIELMRDTIPEPYTLYIPRVLTLRISINRNLFQEVCSDIYVFKGAKPHQLRKIATFHKIEYSSTQIKSGITAKYIVLDHETDWNKIVSAFKKQPVHLIRYEEITDTFLLEVSKRNSSVIQKYITRSDNGVIDYISEDALVNKIRANDFKWVFICDSSGMGKSLLMASIARKLQTFLSDRIVAYIQLRDFFLQNSNFTCAKEAIVNYISTSPLAGRILYELTEDGNTKFELFLDGLDEVQENYWHLLTTFLEEIATDHPEIRVYVASRPRQRSKFEIFFESAYDIQPFSVETQCSFLTAQWSEKDASSDTHKLHNYARIRLKHLQNVSNGYRSDIAGIPVLCRLLAEIYADEAVIYADTNRKVSMTHSEDFPKSLWRFYRMYIHQRLGTSECNFDCIYKMEISELHCNVNCTIKSFHVWQAITLVFPEFARKLLSQVNTFDGLNDEQVLSPGLLRRNESPGKYNCKFQFLHQTVAEFLVAEYFADAIFTKPSQQRHKRISYRPEYIEHLAVDEVFMLGNPQIISIKNFRENSVAYFLNSLLIENYKISEYRCTASLPLTSNDLLRALIGCLRFDYEALLQIIIKSAGNTKEDNLAYHKTFLQRYKSTAISVLEVAATYSKVKTIQKLCQFFLDVLECDLIKFCSQAPYHMSSVKAAIQRADYGVALFFIEKVPLENHGLLYPCLENTYFEDLKLVQKRLDIAELLVSKCNGLLHEPFEAYNSPIHSPRVHLRALRFLIEKGVDFWQRDKSGKTVIFQTAMYMSEEDYFELISLLFEKCQAEKRFLVPPNWKQYFQNFELTDKWSETRALIGHLQLLDPNADTDFINHCKSLLHSVSHPKYNQELKKLLYLAVKTGNEKVVNLLLCIETSLLDIKYDHDQTPVMVATCFGQVKMVKFLARKGANLLALNSNGETILHVAAATKDCQVFHKIVCLLGSHPNDESSKTVSNRTNSDSSEGISELFIWKELRSLQTPLHYAMCLLNLPLATLDLFLTYGNPYQTKTVQQTSKMLNLTDNKKQTALHYALKNKRRVELVKHMISCGADWSLKTESGCNVTHICAQNELYQHLKYFVELGCNVNELDRQGNNALQCTFNRFYEFNPKSNLEKTILVLIGAGADIEHKNLHFNTAYKIAADRNFPFQILKHLTKYP